MKLVLKLFILSFLVMMAACAGGPVHIDDDLAPVEYFQRAQEAAGTRDDYTTALAYYAAFLERFPDDTQRVVEAEYEIAFIHYVQGDLATAEAGFQKLLARYDRPGNEMLPKWPKVLADKLLIEIEIQKESLEETDS